MLFKNTSNKINYTLNCNGKLIIVDKPLVMGIINLTPDSFYASSRITQLEEIDAKVQQMVIEGASIIDLGGQSTRPNATLLSEQNEWERLEKPLLLIRKNFPEILISIDTFHSKIAQKAVAYGADVINDVSCGQMDKAMFATAGKLNVPYIAMHIQGTPQTMQQNPQYEDVVKEVLDYFITKKIQAEEAGIKDIIFDVGFGFGKTIEHNFTLLRNLSTFTAILEKPLLVGLSRKSMVYKTLNTTAEESLNGTTVLHTVALQNGASILRVHDVKQAIEAIRLVANL